MNKDTEAFLSLVRAGLWEKDIRLRQYGEIDFEAILEMADARGVVGLVSAGLEHVSDCNPDKKYLMRFIGRVTLMEQLNKSMNYFIGEVINKMREAGIYTLLVKGQGVAQCYERPMWRLSGDVDLLLDHENYRMAKSFLLPFSSGKKREERYSKHLGISIGQWYVELHGTLRTGLSTRVDRMVDAVQSEVFRDGKVRSWRNNGTDVLLPAPDQDVFMVFTHFIKHLYKDGLGLRQVCDWIRLLWTYRSVLDFSLLECWLRKAGLVEEWKAFSVIAVDWLGIPEEAMPLYDVLYRDKASHLLDFILCGYSGKRIKDSIKIAKVFPWKVLRYSPAIFLNLCLMKVKEWVFPENGWRSVLLMIKWIFDRVVSLFGLLCLWPLLLVVAILIKVKMPGGPVIFVQQRVGRGGKLFNCHKFRTMLMEHDGSLVSVAGDSRITPLGAKLRRWKLDELPGLWDVLRGKMSFVGPRPDVPGYADKLKGKDKDVLMLWPGITGPATLKYRNEEEMIADFVAARKKAGDQRDIQEIALEYNDKLIYPDKVRLNCYYYRHYSFVQDIQIIFCTVLGLKMKYAGEEI